MLAQHGFRACCKHSTSFYIYAGVCHHRRLHQIDCIRTHAGALEEG